NERGTERPCLRRTRGSGSDRPGVVGPPVRERGADLSDYRIRGRRCGPSALCLREAAANDEQRQHENGPNAMVTNVTHGRPPAARAPRSGLALTAASAK